MYGVYVNRVGLSGSIGMSKVVVEILDFRFQIDSQLI